MFKRALYHVILPQLQHKNAIVITGMRQVGNKILSQITLILANKNSAFLFEINGNLKKYHKLTQMTGQACIERLIKD
jgi:hypothetical protein